MLIFLSFHFCAHITNNNNKKKKIHWYIIPLVSWFIHIYKSEKNRASIVSISMFRIVISYRLKS